MSNMKVNFLGKDCTIDMSKTYSNGRIAIQLFDEQGFPMAKASVNLPDHELGENEVFIKNYSENQGILAALTKAGIVELAGPAFEVEVQHKIYKCKILRRE